MQECGGHQNNRVSDYSEAPGHLEAAGTAIEFLVVATTVCESIAYDEQEIPDIRQVIHHQT